MLKHFKESIITAVAGLIAAWFWAGHIQAGSEFKTLFIVFFLSVLEITLSFDNAVVNAVILDKMTPKWQHRFLTWGIIIAVFGVRFLLPVIIVSIFSNLNILKTIDMALEDITQYSHYLHLAHAPLVAFGGSFLMMVGLSYFIGKNNEHKWLIGIENLLSKINFKFAPLFICFIITVIIYFILSDEIKSTVAAALISGILSYEIIHGICNFMEKKQEANLIKNSAHGGFMMFVYLEVLDASFSLDGVLGSFAISKDIIIITIGLAIGAMFVRSLTLLFVERKTLNQYVYLVSGAHFAIMSLAVIMFISIFYEVNEIITGSIGLIFVVSSFISSLIENRKNPDKYISKI